MKYTGSIRIRSIITKINVKANGMAPEAVITPARDASPSALPKPTVASRSFIDESKRSRMASGETIAKSSLVIPKAIRSDAASRQRVSTPFFQPFSKPKSIPRATNSPTATVEPIINAFTISFIFIRHSPPISMCQ